MEGTTEKPRCENQPNTISPQSLLQYIESMYNHWIYNDDGITYIKNSIIEISQLSKHFALCKNKSRSSDDGYMWRIIDYIDNVRFEFKATASLYREIGCASNILTNPQDLLYSNDQFYRELINPLLQIIITQLSKYQPKIHTEQALSTYYQYLNRVLMNKIVAYPDVANKKFQLMVKK